MLHPTTQGFFMHTSFPGYEVAVQRARADDLLSAAGPERTEEHKGGKVYLNGQELVYDELLA